MLSISRWSLDSYPTIQITRCIWHHTKHAFYGYYNACLWLRLVFWNPSFALTALQNLVLSSAVHISFSVNSFQSADSCFCENFMAVIHASIRFAIPRRATAAPSSENLMSTSVGPARCRHVFSWIDLFLISFALLRNFIVYLLLSGWTSKIFILQLIDTFPNFWPQILGTDNTHRRLTKFRTPSIAAVADECTTIGCFGCPDANYAV
jgi:hypothetical protein